MLAKQGEELKAVAKLIDGYVERVNQISSKLGDNETLASVRNNLSKFKDQLTESRTVLSVAGGLLTGTVEKYTAVETRQVKNVDSYKAHNRDFYKNPVVVASAGGAGAGGGAAVAAGMSSSPAPAQTTVNYTENTTVTNNYTQVNVTPEAAAPASAPVEVVAAAPASAPVETPVSTPVETPVSAPVETPVSASVAAPIETPVSAPAAAPVSASAAAPVSAVAPAAASPPAPANTFGRVAAAVTPALAGANGGKVAGIAAGVGLAGAALGAGGALAAKHLAEKKKAAGGKTESNPPEAAENKEDYDPEKELAAALERVRQLSEED
jgi:hypothetical protein